MEADGEGFFYYFFVFVLVDHMRKALTFLTLGPVSFHLVFKAADQVWVSSTIPPFTFIAAVDF